MVDIDATANKKNEKAERRMEDLISVSMRNLIELMLDKREKISHGFKKENAFFQLKIESCEIRRVSKL